MGHFLFSFINVFIALSANAFESLPEYRGLNSREALATDSPQLIDTEYTSDFIVYHRSFYWEPLWWSRPLGYDLTVGSLGGKEFALNQRVRFTAGLTSQLKFHFYWFEDRDLEDDFTAQILELTYWGAKRFGLAAYGSLSRDKAENDVGLAFLARWSDTEGRLYFTLLDFQRNQRNRATDRWEKGHEPKVIGYVQRSIQQDGEHVKAWREWSARYEMPTRWRFPDEQKDYEYQKYALQARGFLQRQENSWAWRANWEDKFESAVTPTSAEQTHRQRLWLQLEEERSLGKPTLRYGLHHLWRRYQGIVRDATFRHWLPYVWWEAPEYLTEYGGRQWLVGYDVALGWLEKSGNWMAADSDTFAHEHRVNVTHRWRFQQSGEIRALLTFDLDELGSDATWEGGAAQVAWAY